jgi:mannosyltransferase OCH1-like enzyme
MIKTYYDLKEYNFIENCEIPKIIIKTGSFAVSDLPIEIANLYNQITESNPHYTLFYFDDDDRLKFIQDNYEERYINAYKKLIPKAYQADLFRYLILYKYGGVYMDFSMSPLIPLDDIIKSYKEVYVRDRLSMPIIYNAFISTIKQSKILEKCIAKCIKNIENNDYGYDSLCVTSPIILGETFAEIEIQGLFVDGKIQLGRINDNLFVYSFENGDNEFFKNPENGQFVVKNKIDNHYNIVYKDKVNTLYYPRLWENRIVFRDERFIEIENIYKEVTKNKIDLGLVVFLYTFNIEKSEIKNIIINKMYENK